MTEALEVWPFGGPGTVATGLGDAAACFQTLFISVSMETIAAVFLISPEPP